MSKDIATIIDNAILKCFVNQLYLLEQEDTNVLVDYINEFLKQEKINIDICEIQNRISKICEYRRTLHNLNKLPLIKQRTNEWFELRKDRLTASDLYDAIKDGNTSTKLAMKKANITVDTTNYNNIPPLKWGTMFENMASRCYSQANNNINIQEFGLICDMVNSHFGASPDGINDLGIMIEIKCPYSRKIIEDFIPAKYYMQIQGQLAVCNLKECDYIECDFKTFNSHEEYLSNVGNDLVNHGVIAEYKTSNNEYSYLYSDTNLSPCDAISNIQEQIKTCITDNTFSKLITWQLVEMKIQRVKFDEKEWTDIDNKITIFWDKVEQMKIDPPIIQKSKKRIKFIDDE